MDWGQILGKVLPTGGIAVIGWCRKEWKGMPNLTGTTKIIPIVGADVVEFSINIENRVDRPLFVNGYTVEQRYVARYVNMEVRKGLLDIEHQPAGADLSGRVHTAIRIPPYLGGADWPRETIVGRIEAASWTVNRLVVTIFAPHTFFGLKRESLTLKLDVDRRPRKPIVPNRPRLERPRA